MSNSTKFTLGIAGAGSVGSQLMTNGTVDLKTLGIDLTTAYLLKGKGAILTVGGNTAAGAFNSYVTDQSVFDGAISSGIGSAVGYGVGKAIEIRLNNKYPDLTWSKYNPQPLSDKLPYIYTYRRSIIPSTSGSLGGEFLNRGAQHIYNESQKGSK